MSHGDEPKTDGSSSGIENTEVVTISNEIISLLEDLCKSLQPEKSESDLSQMLLHSVQYIAQCPNSLNSPLQISEASCVRKIVNNLNANATKGDDELPGELFMKYYNQLIELPLEPHSRHSLLNLMLLLMDSDSDSDMASESDKQKEQQAAMQGHRRPSLDILYSRVRSEMAPKQIQDRLANLTSRTRLPITSIINDSKLARELNGKRTALGLKIDSCNPEGMPSYSYDSSQQSMGLLKEPVPDFMDCLKGEINLEYDVVQCAIFSFTGIQNAYLKKDCITGRFKIDQMNSVKLTAVEAGMLLRLSELGYYHDRVSQFANVKTGFTAMGCMGQALIAVLKRELTHYHGEVAMLQDEMGEYNKTQARDFVDRNKTWSEGGKNQLTLLKLLCWYGEPLHRMQWVTKIADACQMKKGGELASVVYDFLETGDPIVNQLANDYLTAICGPLVRMISRWMLEGGIEDPHGEFFVESLAEVGADRLWYDKFRLRINTLPKFMGLDLAMKILKTGKSINFLREICEMQGQVKGRDELKQIIENNAAQIFSYVQDTRFHAAIETAYQQTSKHVLDIMVGPHKLLDHLHGMRRYLLLGQGDFVSILIENMKDELEKKGSDIYAHDLSTMLDAALRCTNAQYDDPDILNHLDVVVQTPYPGDCGWDIISLQYTVQGPLATMLEPTMLTYKTLFKPLWRMKHMEFVLSMKIWKEQMSNSKTLRSMSPEIGKACYGLHLFTSEIMHFVHQMQYYVLFEVIECNWVELQKRMQQATALDDILEAHEKFLRVITVGCFVNTLTDMERSLEVVYDNIICLETWQSNFYAECFKELQARQNFAARIQNSEQTGHFGITAAEQMERDQERKMFEQKMIAACRNLESITMAYEKAVGGFLLSLNSNNDPNLQLFGTRLDFNEYYKKRDISLSKPLTFEHMRMSNVFNLYSKK